MTFTFYFSQLHAARRSLAAPLTIHHLLARVWVYIFSPLPRSVLQIWVTDAGHLDFVPRSSPCGPATPTTAPWPSCCLTALHVRSHLLTACSQLQTSASAIKVVVGLQQPTSVVHNPECKVYAVAKTGVRTPADLDSRPYSERINYTLTERDGIKGPPAGNKTRCARTHKATNKATQRKVKPNQNPKPTHGAQSRPKPPQSRAGQDPASGSVQRLAL
jgi:hypothetical protein